MERYWSKECEVDYIMTHVQLGEIKPVLRKRWNEIRLCLMDANICQQLVLLLKEPVMNLLYNDSRKRPGKSEMLYVLDLMDAIEGLARSGQMDTEEVAWLLVARNFNSRPFVDYYIRLLEKELNGKELDEEKLSLLVSMQRQTAYLGLFAQPGLVPAALPVKDVVNA
ncbi:hypothetical protein [Filimonas lacunae]|uniref:hypothetical protein n=1 Tax=Filimonas lacunae TaxID=477680 RepID=UPI00118683F5|nr:hypothetical protein [Filimonas lacunae]